MILLVMGIRIPKPSRQEALRQIITEDEAFRFPIIKLDKDKPRFHLPEPVEDDEENVELKPNFRAVVIIAKRNFYQSDEDKEEGKEPKERRELYVVREGKIKPERMFLSPSSVRHWQAGLKEVKDAGVSYWECVMEFSADRVASTKTKFKWSVVKIKFADALDPDEIAYVDDLREMVKTRVKDYASSDELSALEDEMLDDEPQKKPKLDPEERHSRAVSASLDAEDDEEEEEKPKRKPNKAESKTKATKKASLDDEDDEEEKPQRKKKTADDDDLPKGKAKEPELADDDDEDEEEEPKPKSTKKPSLDEDDEEDEEFDKLVGKDTEKKESTKRKPSLDDDDDDD